mmetsp:Transcript_15422/g.36392  ORF Transcript_15422/g.36392 Transcript_15422/m.36392 type:complete len:348 (-) Transcript_15422:325-1368(-)
MLQRQFLELLQHDRLQVPHIVKHVLLQHVLHSLVGASQSYRMGVEGGAPANGVRHEVILDLLSDSDHGQRHEGGGEALGGSHDVRHNTFEVLEAEEMARAAETNHDLIANEQDVVLVTQSPEALHVSLGWDQDTTSTHDAFNEDGSNGLWPFSQDLVLEAGQSSLCCRVVCGAPAEAVRLWVEELHEAVLPTLREFPAEVARGAQGGGRGPMVGPVLCEDLVLARVQACEADSSLVCLASATGEEEACQVSRANLSQKLRKLRPDGSQPKAAVHVRQRVQLLVDPLLDYFRDRVSQIHTNCLARPVQVLLAVSIVEVNSLTTLNHWQGLHRIARCPGEHHMFVSSFP